MPVSPLEWSVPFAFFLFGMGFIIIGRLGFPTAPWGAAFCFLGGGYAFTLFHTSHFSAVKPLGEDLLWLIGTAALCRALLKRFKIRPNYLAKAAIIGAALAAAAAALSIAHNIRWETFSIQTGCAALLVHCLWRINRRIVTRADRILFIGFAIVAAILAVQCVGYLFAANTGPQVGAWHESLWGIVLQYTGLFIAIFLSFSILLAISLDLIDTYRGYARLDPLTSILNRRGFEEFVATLSDDTPAALLLADLDDFKRINDNFGHHVGDAVIAGFAAVLRGSVGADGCAARLGGEEFIAVIPRLSLEGAATVADGIRQAFMNRRWMEIPVTAEITTSIGVCMLSSKAEIIVAMARADECLYLAKRTGRNRVITETELAVWAEQPADMPTSPTDIDAFGAVSKSGI